MDDSVDKQKAGQKHHEDEDIHGCLLAEIEHAEEKAARDGLNAVLATGERRFDREEIHHLRQRQRDHREIDALAADGEGAGDEPEPGSECGADQNGEFRRQVPRFGCVGAHIGGPSEIQCVTKRQQACIADQKIERAGKQRKAQDLHQEHGIDDGGRDRKKRDHGCKSRRLAPASAALEGDEGVDHVLHVTLSVQTDRPA